MTGKLVVAGLAAFLLAAAPAWAFKEGHQREPLRGVHSLDVYADGDVLHVLTGEYPASVKAPQLRYRRSADGGATWSAPFRVDSGIKPYQAIHRGNDAQIAARGKQLVAVWHTPGTGFHGSGPMATAISADGGASWRPGPNPADDGSTAGHSYIDIAADAAGFHLVWLDGRSGNQGLQYARSRNGGGSWERNARLVERTCECCWNTVLPQPNGLLHVLYRAYDPRDMMLMSSTDAGANWRNRGAVGRFDWKVQACPHTGGALVAGPAARLHALSWTGRDGVAGLHVMVSEDGGGGSWKQTHRLGSNTAQRGDLAAYRSSLAAVWDEHADGGTAVFASIFAGGTGWGAPRRLSAAGTHATHPRVAATATGFLVLWTEQAKGGPNVLRQALVAAP